MNDELTINEIVAYSFVQFSDFVTVYRGSFQAKGYEYCLRHPIHDNLKPHLTNKNKLWKFKNQSKKQKKLFSVPLGSVLRPFMMYINDLPHICLRKILTIFADNQIFFRPIAQIGMKI